MKFLVEHNFPRGWLVNSVLRDMTWTHTLSLPNGNRTTDQEIASVADEEDRVVVTKDCDFRDAYLLKSTPRRLFLVETGNISNNDLMALFDKNLAEMVSLDPRYDS